MCVTDKTRGEGRPTTPLLSETRPPSTSDRPARLHTGPWNKDSVDTTAPTLCGSRLPRARTGPRADEESHPFVPVSGVVGS